MLTRQFRSQQSSLFVVLTHNQSQNTPPGTTVDLPQVPPCSTLPSNTHNHPCSTQSPQTQSSIYIYGWNQTVSRLLNPIPHSQVPILKSDLSIEHEKVKPGIGSAMAFV